jgi:hypothetical protein
MVEKVEQNAKTIFKLSRIKSKWILLEKKHIPFTFLFF